MQHIHKKTISQYKLHIWEYKCTSRHSYIEENVNTMEEVVTSSASEIPATNTTNIGARQFKT